MTVTRLAGVDCLKRHCMKAEDCPGDEVNSQGKYRHQNQSLNKSSETLAFDIG
jgi:hypothetical protein